MWTQLVEIVKARCQHSRHPRHRLAKAVTTCYGGMNNCHEAFLNYKTDQTDTNFANFVFSIDALISTLHNLNPKFNIFDPELSAQLQHYTLEENRAAYIHQPHDRVRFQIKLLRQMIKLEANIMELSIETLGDFDQALETLGNFIKDHFTIQEIFAAEAKMRELMESNADLLPHK